MAPKNKVAINENIDIALLKEELASLSKKRGVKNMMIYFETESKASLWSLSRSYSKNFGMIEMVKKILNNNLARGVLVDK